MPSLWGWLKPSPAMVAASRPASGPEVASTRQFYRSLDAYYRNIDLYNNLSALARAGTIDSDLVAGLRSPVNRVVEFHAKKLWPGTLADALPIVGPKPSVIAAIEQVRTWSNFQRVKQILAREGPLYGDFFLKTATRNDPPQAGETVGKARRVYHQRIDPMFVTDFEEDERFFATRVRLDIPKDEVDLATRTVIPKTRTEIWDKRAVRIWRVHGKGEDAAEFELGPPDEEMPLAQWGIDFVPFVRAPFRDIGDTRGVSAFQHALDKIDDLNRSATRLHRMLFRHNKNTWVVESALRGPDGRLLGALNFGDDEDEDGQSILSIGDEQLYSLTGGYTLRSMVPDIRYADALAILESDIREVEDDLPEMAYYRARDLGSQLSGVALRLILGPAIDTAIEARGNAHDALVRANQMALTIGVAVGLFDRSIGTYEAGDFDHTFVERPVIALTEVEEAAVAKAKQDAGVPRRQTLIDTLGYDPDTVDEWEQERQQAADQQMAQVNLQRAQFALQQDQGAQQQPGGNITGVRDRIQSAATNPNGG